MPTKKTNVTTKKTNVTTKKTVSKSLKNEPKKTVKNNQKKNTNKTVSKKNNNSIPFNHQAPKYINACGLTEEEYKIQSITPFTILSGLATISPSRIVQQIEEYVKESDENLRVFISFIVIYVIGVNSFMNGIYANTNSDII